jgi:hypothetical protein
MKTPRKASGIYHGQARFNRNQIIEIRACPLSSYRLARLFDVSIQTISKIRKSKTYAKNSRGKPVRYTAKQIANLRNESELSSWSRDGRERRF